MSGSGRSTETDIAIATMRVLAATSTGTATMRTLINRIPKHCLLSQADQETSDTRPNEEMWEQQVRNITSHHSSPGNYIHEGYLERIPRGLAITDKGRAHLKSLGG